jgi:hypothetical protein
MFVFCKKFLSKQKYEKLLSENAFEVVTDKNMLKKCFKNALVIYSVVCLSGSEFITDYVQKNYEACQ